MCWLTHTERHDKVPHTSPPMTTHFYHQPKIHKRQPRHMYPSCGAPTRHMSLHAITSNHLQNCHHSTWSTPWFPDTVMTGTSPTRLHHTHTGCQFTIHQHSTQQRHGSQQESTKQRAETNCTYRLQTTSWISSSRDSCQTASLEKNWDWFNGTRGKMAAITCNKLDGTEDG